jgi:peptide/nickel transport system permease protein
VSTPPIALGRPEPVAVPRRRRPLRELAANAWRFGTTKVGAAIVGVVVAVVVIGPLVVTRSPRAFVAQPYTRASSGLLLGADVLGRDVLARSVHGGRLLLVLALSSAVLGVVFGTIVGLIAGSTRSRWGEAIMRASDVLLSFPRLVLILLVLAALGRNVWAVPLLVGVTWMPEVARVVRAVTMAVMEQDHISAARALGIGRVRLLLGEVLPNVSGPILVEFGIRFTWSIGVVAALSFLGLGVAPSTPDWGLMINENRGGLALQPWGVLAPAVLVLLASVGTNLITDGLARAAARTDVTFLRGPALDAADAGDAGDAADPVDAVDPRPHTGHGSSD